MLLHAVAHPYNLNQYHTLNNCPKPTKYCIVPFFSPPPCKLLTLIYYNLALIVVVNVTFSLVDYGMQYCTTYCFGGYQMMQMICIFCVVKSDWNSITSSK